jgi:phosphoribosylglycinamide formyltransferase 2
VVEGKSNQVKFNNLEKVQEEPDTSMRIFGKAEVDGHRRMAVILARDESVETAVAKAERAFQKLDIEL